MKNIIINTHSSINIDSIYFDPYNIECSVEAKIIFVTHSHYDHLDLKSINKIFGQNTVIVAPQNCIDILIKEGYPKDSLISTKPNAQGDIKDIHYETFASYNINKPFHPKANGWVGYTITIDNVRYTICGDSDLTDELKNIKTDVLFVPIGGTYTMTAIEGAELTNIIRPRIAIPVHYGSIVGSFADAQEYISKVDKDINVQLLIKER